MFDCHTHLFGIGHVGGSFLSDARRAWGDDYSLTVTADDHWNLYGDSEGAIVLAFNAPATGVVVPDEYVAGYTKRAPTRLFGFSSVNPHDPRAPEKLEYAIRELGLRGLKLAPIYQNFYPDDKKYFPLYRKAAELNIPILWHQGTSFVSQGFLEASRPALLDPIARAFPNLTMIIAHLGHPWHGECAAVVRKHPRMFADMSALGSRPWQFYNAMMNFYEYGVADKVLFGSDYPFFTPEKTRETLLAVNDLTEGTSLPRIPEAVLQRILDRNIPELLGLH